MNSEDTRKRIDEIYAEKEVLEQERKTIQGNCSHDSYTVGDWYWRIAASFPAKICDHCDANIGEPSPEELKRHEDDTAYLNKVTIGTYGGNKKDNEEDKE